MKKINNILNSLTLSKKIVLIFIGATFFPLFMQNLFYYSDTEKKIQSEMMQRLDNSLVEIKNGVNNCISETINLSLRYNTNEEMYKFLDFNYSSDIKYFIEYEERIKDVLLLDVIYNKYVRKVSLYTDNKTIFTGSLINKIDTNNLNTLG
jgi:two-component system sensor histidine kinase YesM